MLPVRADTIRLFLHVLAAMVWVGGQLTLGALIPAVRTGGTELVRKVARQFQLVAWPAYAVLLITGGWNLAAVHLSRQSSAWLTTLSVKLVCVFLTGAFAAAHILVAAPRVRAAETPEQHRRAAAMSGAFESLSLLFALAAAFMGIMLA
ncbi:MAG TPA: CopD family protein [Acidimicrobiia bacterium]|nr:CopD family protein [Acidimicrobiia bacterium]